MGNLTVHLTALTGRFGKGMRKAQRTVSAFAAEVGAASLRLTKLATGASVVAATATAYLTARQMDAIDSTAKVADRLGVSTEALIGMRHAAKLAGVGTEEFDGAMQKLGKNLANPSTETVEALDKIGLSTHVLLGMDPARRFGAIADGINKLGTQEQKAAVATALFGKQGMNLLNTLDLGSAGLAKAADEATRLGAAYSRIDAAKVEEANDAASKLGVAFDGIFQRLAIEFSPFVTAAAESLLDFGTNGRSAADVIGEGIVNATRSALRLVDVVDVLVAGFHALRGIAHSLAGAWDKAVAFTTEKLAVGGHLIGVVDEDTLDLLSNDLADLQESAAASMAKAVSAFADSRAALAKAVAGERSGAAQATFDAIRKSATERATKVVGDQAAGRRAATAAERKEFGKSIADGIRSAFDKTMAGVAQAKIAAEGSLLVGSLMERVGGFFRSLPERAAAMGVGAAPMQTAVRGTFAGELGGRLTGQLSIQTKQLEAQRNMLSELQGIRSAVAGGIALP